jgi:hypothetical protein
MAKIKGSPKTGGRRAGTPNKVTGTIREFLSALIDNQRDQIEADLKKLQPKVRLIILERLMQYVIPKQNDITTPEPPQSVKVEIVGDSNKDFPSSEDEIDGERDPRYLISRDGR